MEDTKSVTHKETKPAGCLGTFLRVVFFPIIVSVWIWHQKWNKATRIVIIAVFWILLIVIGSRSQTTTPNSTSTAIIGATVSPTIQEAPLTSDEEAYVASRSAYINQLLSKDDAIQNDLKTATGSTQHLLASVLDANDLIGKLDYCLLCNKPPARFKNYNEFFSTTEENASYSLTQIACKLLNHPDADISDLKKMYVESIGLLRNTHPKPDASYDKENSVMDPDSKKLHDIRCLVTLHASGSSTAFGVSFTNDDTADWGGCQVGIGALDNPDAYVSDSFDLPSHSTKQVPWVNLAKQDGTRFNIFTTKPSEINLTCSVHGLYGEGNVIF